MNYTDRMRQWADDIEAALGAAPAGLTRDQLMADVGIPTVNEFHQAKGVLQEKLGPDTISVVGDSSTALQGGWTYSLQSARSPVTTDYLVKKEKGMFTRTLRAYSVSAATARGIPGTSALGRLARRQARSLYSTLENTVDVLTELGLPAPPLPPRI